MENPLLKFADAKGQNQQASQQKPQEYRVVHETREVKEEPLGPLYSGILGFPIGASLYLLNQLLRRRKIKLGDMLLSGLGGATAASVPSLIGRLSTTKSKEEPVPQKSESVYIVPPGVPPEKGKEFYGAASGLIGGFFPGIAHAEYQSQLIKNIKSEIEKDPRLLRAIFDLVDEYRTAPPPREAPEPVAPPPREAPEPVAPPPREAPEPAAQLPKPPPSGESVKQPERERIILVTPKDVQDFVQRLPGAQLLPLPEDLIAEAIRKSHTKPTDNTLAAVLGGLGVGGKEVERAKGLGAVVGGAAQLPKPLPAPSDVVVVPSPPKGEPDYTKPVPKDEFIPGPEESKPKPPPSDLPLPKPVEEPVGNKGKPDYTKPVPKDEFIPGPEESKPKPPPPGESVKQPAKEQPVRERVIFVTPKDVEDFVQRLPGPVQILPLPEDLIAEAIRKSIKPTDNTLAAVLGGLGVGGKEVERAKGLGAVVGGAAHIPPPLPPSPEETPTETTPPQPENKVWIRNQYGVTYGFNESDLKGYDVIFDAAGNPILVPKGTTYGQIYYTGPARPIFRRPIFRGPIMRLIRGY